MLLGPAGEAYYFHHLTDDARWKYLLPGWDYNKLLLFEHER